jgi:hypothetical protein
MATEKTVKSGKAAIEVTVREISSGDVVRGARIFLYKARADTVPPLHMDAWHPQDAITSGLSDESGLVRFANLPGGSYVLQYPLLPPLEPMLVKLGSGKTARVEFCVDFDVVIETAAADAGGQCKPGLPRAGGTLLLHPRYHYSKKVDVVLSELRSRGNTRFECTVDKGGEHHFSHVPDVAGNITFRFEFRIFPVNGKYALSTIEAAAQGTATGGIDSLRQYASFHVTKEVEIMACPDECSHTVGVRLGRSDATPSDDTAFWAKIKSSTESLSFENYMRHIDFLINPRSATEENNNGERYASFSKTNGNLKATRAMSFTNGDAYRLLKVATEAFVMVNTGIDGPDQATAGNPGTTALPQNEKSYMRQRDISVPSESEEGSPTEQSAFERYVAAEGILPYLALIHKKMPKLDIVSDANLNEYNLNWNYQLIQERMRFPCMLELIWSYWHEEGMMVQTMNAVTRRFQNVRGPQANDPLANLEIDPLRPLNNIIWGYVQDEQNRLTVVRRNYEYDHHYGLRLEGKAVQNFRPVDTRSKFLEAFHHLLRMCSMFYKQDDDTTVKADAFPVLNALKEVHLILSQGAHNQFGDLPSTARVEMLMQQMILARPEFRDFLPTRMMVAYPEPWMDRVDAMKKLQGWTDTSVIHFRSLAMFGEQLLLSVRFGAWSDVYEPSQAFNWARFWRPQAQGYIHAYRAVTGVDLTGTAVDTIVDATMPSVLLQRRLNAQMARAI